MMIREATAVDAVGIARVHVDSWRTAYRGIIPDDILDGLTYEQRQQMWAKNLGDPVSQEFVYVAEDETGQIVGFASGGPSWVKEEPLYTGELFAIYLLDAYRGKGLGQRLFYQVVARLQQMDLNSMLIWVLAENPARRFYEKLGGQYIKDGVYQRNGRQFAQVAYGWRDLRLPG